MNGLHALRSQLVVPVYHRALKTASSITMHIAASSVDRVDFVAQHSECDCVGCQLNSVEMIKMQWSPVSWLSVPGGTLTVDLLPEMEEMVKMCVNGNTWVANVVVVGVDQCRFKLQDDNPCVSGLCDGENVNSEECHSLVGEYCIEHPEDEGCSHYMPMFERPVRLFQTCGLMIAATDEPCRDANGGRGIEMAKTNPILLDKFHLFLVEIVCKQQTRS